VAGESVLLGGYVALLRRTGRLAPGDREGLVRLIARWESSPVGLLRSYVRAMKSLVVMAEHEIVPGAVG
jgi:hypothetical protein